MKDEQTAVESVMTVAVAPSPYEDIRQRVAVRTGESPDRIRLVEMPGDYPQVETDRGNG